MAVGITKHISTLKAILAPLLPELPVPHTVFFIPATGYTVIVLWVIGIRTLRHFMLISSRLLILKSLTFKSSTYYTRSERTHIIMCYIVTIV